MKTLLLLLASLGLAPPAPTVNLTVHDAAGRTFNVTARWNPSSFVFDGATQTITLDVTTDGLFCGSFER